MTDYDVFTVKAAISVALALLGLMIFSLCLYCFCLVSLRENIAKLLDTKAKNEINKHTGNPHLEDGNKFNLEGEIDLTLKDIMSDRGRENRKIVVDIIRKVLDLDHPKLDEPISV